MRAKWVPACAGTTLFDVLVRAGLLSGCVFKPSHLFTTSFPANKTSLSSNFRTNAVHKSAPPLALQI
jgi:hypothetical protein